MCISALNSYSFYSQCSVTHCLLTATQFNNHSTRENLALFQNQTHDYLFHEQPVNLSREQAISFVAECNWKRGQKKSLNKNKQPNTFCLILPIAALHQFRLAWRRRVLWDKRWDDRHVICSTRESLWWKHSTSACRVGHLCSWLCRWLAVYVPDFNNKLQLSNKPLVSTHREITNGDYQTSLQPLLTHYTKRNLENEWIAVSMSWDYTNIQSKLT